VCAAIKRGKTTLYVYGAEFSYRIIDKDNNRFFCARAIEMLHCSVIFVSVMESDSGFQWKPLEGAMIRRFKLQHDRRKE
jgi:hypothetical protein